MKIQITPTKRVKDVMTVWPEYLPDVDIVMNPNAPVVFPFNAGKLDTIYAFHSLGVCAPEHIEKTLSQWLRSLKKGGKLVICENDFEKIARLFVGGDITSAEFNEKYNQRSHMVKEDLTMQLLQVGVPKDDMKVWFGHNDFQVDENEFILEIKKSL